MGIGYFRLEAELDDGNKVSLMTSGYIVAVEERAREIMSAIEKNKAIETGSVVSDALGEIHRSEWIMARHIVTLRIVNV